MTSPNGAADRPAVAVDGAWFAYNGGRAVLRGISMRAERGQVTMLMGQSGCGKTTLLKVIRGLLPPQRGRIEVLGRLVRPASRGGRLDRRVAYIPQQLGLVRSLSVLDNVLMGALGYLGTLPSLLRLYRRVDHQQARDLLRQLGIERKAAEKVQALSGGERQRVAIARALMQRPEIVLADEFISQLDPVTSSEIMDIVHGIARSGVALVVTTHDLDVVARYADQVLVVRDGATVLACPAREARVDALSLALKG